MQPEVPNPFVLFRSVLELLANEAGGLLGVEARMLIDEGPKVLGMRHRWIRRVAVPILGAYLLAIDPEVKRGVERARELLARCEDENWRVVCLASLKSDQPAHT